MTDQKEKSNYPEYPPKEGQGEQPSDQEIHQYITHKLSNSKDLDTKDVHIEVNQGKVTARGTVPDEKQKHEVRFIIETSKGVKDFFDFIKPQNSKKEGENPSRVTQAGTLRDGMIVNGKNGNAIGSIKELRNNDFLVKRALARDVYVPFNAVQRVDLDEIAYLSIPASEVDHQGWQNP